MYHEAVEQQNVAGRDITNCLMTKLMALLNIDYYTVEQIKEHCCYVADDYHKELASRKAKSYKLPDGRNNDLGSECFTCPEAMFRFCSTPLNLTYGVHEMVNRAILRCSQDAEESGKYLYGNIYAPSGGILMERFRERLSKETKALAPSEFVRVVAPMDPSFQHGLVGQWSEN